MKYSRQLILVLTFFFLASLPQTLTQEIQQSPSKEEKYVQIIENSTSDKQEHKNFQVEKKESGLQLDEQKPKDKDDEVDDDLQLLRDHGALFGSFLSILVTEIGDKTFIVTAILATKYDKKWVFIGSFGALFLMTLISCVIGTASLSFIDESYIKIVAAALFFGFGGKAVYEAITNKIEDEEEEIEHDIKELEEKINQKAHINKDENNDTEKQNEEENQEKQNDLETQQLQQSLLKSQEKQNKKNAQVIPNTLVAAQTFTQNFLGEWGDRSQISTIAMSASFNFIQVFIGCALGHAACSYLAITGGKMLAEKFSERTLTLAGGILFIIYGIITVFTI
ncbi:transmembrane protein (macronuclear) [Tetrahymena thermophila SB210]|uniref:GDT1 family protein n=1 Tax=Tetrahymena thermophila (strain SB210) TaxID=312017 RepID=Q24C14_TETTS|nr:transmembrane protein [Tetrahymena thermophila SB210]EAS05288.1 transmembrane protein [Tetrahymena thermophila SB210]|eukprot:XP_001025533.1 transmembrane protein [Tetrahymena thermophila SB210]